MPNPNPTRRQVLTTTAAAVGGAMVPYWLTGSDAQAAQVAAKNDRPRIGAIGIGGRGSAVLGLAAKFGDVVAVCDVDRNHAERARQRHGGKATIFDDYRKLLDRNDIDVIVNATPDHWHTAVNVAACRAGKDIYTEKPLTLTIDEGKILSKVVEETKRVVQVGTQQRSERAFQNAVELVRNGRVGKLKQVWIALPYYTTKAAPFASEPVPSHLNWDLYQGQAPQHEYCRQRTHSNFRWWYEYAGGIITDWGNHHMDIAHWGADCELTGPVSIEARGMFPNHGAPDSFNTPDRFFSRMLYPNGVEMLYFSSVNDRQRYGGVANEHVEMTPEKIATLFGDNCPDEIKSFDRNGIMFIGDQGRIFVNRGGVYGKPVDELKDNPLPDDAWRVPPSNDHMGNFFECVKTRHEPVSPVRIQHRTISACHLTNISIRLNRKLAWDPETQQMVGDDDANSWQKREQRTPHQIHA
ncbi:MAG: Gfo/Idh/MocA family oxidoreductase [Fuerstiella sp.]|nr:Gfo/Idh/MocA family oxidoreductase [Fuerstiella sp.]MCP4857877.1 Gfo/Idh/MocA family oxidoreductase [Fuerstiella sp.]